VLSSGYRIIVKGRFSDRLGSGFEGVSIERSPGRTTLGLAGDRQQLDALLERLRDLKIELVRVDARG
jgi:hypothetical protein